MLFLLLKLRVYRGTRRIFIMVVEIWIGLNAAYCTSAFCGHEKIYDSFDCSGKERSKIYQNVVLGLLVIVQLFFMMPTHFSAPEVNDHITNGCPAVTRTF